MLVKIAAPQLPGGFLVSLNTEATQQPKSQSKNHPQPESYLCTVSLMSNWSCGVRDKNKSFLKKVSGPESENTSEMQISTVVPILETKLSEIYVQGQKTSAGMA